jgi:hypothetical protein
MAKKSGKRKTRGHRVGKPRRTTANRSAPVTARAMSAHQEDHIDGCDVEFLDRDATPDSALPAATGGVEGEGRRRRPAQRIRLRSR